MKTPRSFFNQYVHYSGDTRLKWLRRDVGAG